MLDGQEWPNTILQGGIAYLYRYLGFIPQEGKTGDRYRDSLRVTAIPKLAIGTSDEYQDSKTRTALVNEIGEYNVGTVGFDTATPPYTITFPARVYPSIRTNVVIKEIGIKLGGILFARATGNQQISASRYRPYTGTLTYHLGFL